MNILPWCRKNQSLKLIAIEFPLNWFNILPCNNVAYCSVIDFIFWQRPTTLTLSYFVDYHGIGCLNSLRGKHQFAQTYFLKHCVQIIMLSAFSIQKKLTWNYIYFDLQPATCPFRFCTFKVNKNKVIQK